jgi:hypothetical protein
MTDKPVVSLVPLAKSWIYPAELKVTGNDFISEGYNFRERAYIVNCKKAGSNFECKVIASAKSPLINPAFVIKNWGDRDVELKIDGRKIKRGKNFRFGHRHRIEGSDLIVWLKTESTKPIEISLSATMK